jgi:hypothetical protein
VTGIVAAVCAMAMIAHLVTVVSGAVYIPVTKMPIVIVVANANSNAIRANNNGIRRRRWYERADT